MNGKNRDNTLLTSGDTEIVTEPASRVVQAEEHEEQLRAIVRAARRYRDAMREYRAEQMAMVDCGVSLENLVMRNWRSFAVTQEAEEELFATLEALDVSESR